MPTTFKPVPLFPPTLATLLLSLFVRAADQSTEQKRRRASVKHEDPETDNGVPLALNGRKLPKASETAIGEKPGSDVPIERNLAANKKKIQQKAKKEAKVAHKKASP
ncbi:hypothetical protein CBS63078_9071 [Aspergillus niger]|uniref:Uncharacterized protein n=3 Tax=Aspergillus niger TaxID=5061 RepID=G3XTG2_ASPNA|nr:uncharacterized protein BO96DRAFT_386694 [Aspergillus niger CBS 101883]EHA26029.1 hypothetical protein ASPNIDRAFT_36544 [Aspergillus niger ATCC 1015]KAI2815531.1 hypothetical protein CBS115989_7603 [Aspergillus niger]RDH19706.1 hypothetical protein M747DRAFT_341982 [Aspergillus niger ATCC 13496]KAI2824684.1 hypothetical protein CBS133816_8815 [Aspergillus niger]KAI2841446.1 hypothetical protein CBS11232_8775 [Aspergillus niger]